MVRRKEDFPAREVNIRVAKKAPREESEEAAPRLRRPLRTRRGGGGGKAFLVTLVVILLLGLGWFGARAAIQGFDLTNGGKAGWLATLFNIKVTKLVGEEDGRVNILLMGIPGDPKHDGPNLTDTLMVASYNVNDKYLHLFSLPRDLQVSAADNLGTMKINAVYETGQSRTGDGATELAKTVENVVGLDIPYYIRIDFAGFKQLIDELGGVKIDVKKDLSDPNYPNDSGGVQLFEVKAGSYTMDGDMALKYARSRQSTSDFDRARRQQDVIMAIRAKASDLGLLTAPAKMFAISDIIKDHMATNLNKDEMTRLMKLVSDFNPANITNKVFDDSAAGLLVASKSEGGAYILTPVGGDYNKIKDFVAQAITQTTPETTPAPEEPTATPLKIEVFNGTSTTGLAGKAADKLKAAGYTIVKVGNNPTRGIAKTTVYGSSEAAASAISALAAKANGMVSTDKVALPAGVDARVVIGADYPTQ